MKKATIFAALITASAITFAQSNSAEHSVNKEVTNSQVIDFGKPEEAQEIVTEIMNVIGLKQNFTLRAAKVSNAEASISRHKRYILYNPEFIGWINNSTKDKWASVALLAHEIGHHLNGHTLRKSGNRLQLELEADEFAGFVLRKMGASLEQSQRVMNYIAKEQKSKTHPARADRMLAIKNGWSKAVAPSVASTETAINKTQDSPQNTISN